MRDIDEVMMEMEKISEEIAAELAEQGKNKPSLEELKKNFLKGGVPAEGQLLYEYKADPSVDASCCGDTAAKLVEQIDPPCTDPCNRFANFCCVTEIPDGLSVKTIDEFRIVYDPSGLRCCVEECTATTITPSNCPNLTLPIYAVRIIGCIPVSMSLLAFFSRCGLRILPSPTIADNRINLCCSTTICVNNVICYRGTRAEAEAACEAIRAALAANPCTAVTLFSIGATVLPVNFGACSDRLRILAFSGSFALPLCPIL